MRTFYTLLLICILTFLFAGTLSSQWVQTNGPYGGEFFSLTVNGTNLFAGTEGGVFLSTNNGTGWAAVNTGLTNTHVYSLVVSGTNLFAGTSGGVFLSTNNGANWTEVDTGLTNIYVQALGVSSDHIFAGTASGSVWKRLLSEMITSVHPSSEELPKEFSLQQNYPNPFNPTTSISYQLPRPSHVTLKVFDALGREIATLVDGAEEPGYKSATFDASKLSSGIYFYRLQAGNYIETKKLLLLR